MVLIFEKKKFLNNSVKVKKVDFLQVIFSKMFFSKNEDRQGLENCIFYNW